MGWYEIVGLILILVVFPVLWAKGVDRHLGYDENEQAWADFVAAQEEEQWSQ